MNYNDEYEKWEKIEFLDKKLKNELKDIKNDEKGMKDRFSCYLEFGTAGMRGTMGAGTNRINYITIRRATLGIAKYIINNHKESSGVVIAYDSRNNSKEFANYIAKIFSEFSIKVYIGRDLRPTPFLSYAVLNLKTCIGINITASHNRKEDNGYKVYLSDGAQFSPPEDQKIIDLVNKVTDEEIFVDPKSVKGKKEFISFIPKEIENNFLNEALDIIINKELCKKEGKNLKVVYTPLHGTGSIFLKEGFKRAGFTNVHIVKEQDDKCGEFKTIPYPNPESAPAFDLAIKLAKKVDADIIVATDPDADRMGVYVKVSKGEYLPLTGNELNSILFEYVCHFKGKTTNLKNSLAVKSFVTTRLIDAIAKHYGVELKETPTGFKWICKEINKSKKKQIIACEESYGCSLSDYVRDKDGIGTTLFVCEMALELKKAHFTLYDFLKMLYNYYGIHKCYAFSIVYEGIEGKEKMAGIMDKLRNTPFTSLAGINVSKIYDYKNLIITDICTKKQTKFDFGSTNTLKFILSDNNTITIRPSGTEPKIKIYFDIIAKTDKEVNDKIQIFEKAIKKELS